MVFGRQIVCLANFRWRLGTLPPCEELRPRVGGSGARAVPIPATAPWPLALLPSECVFFRFLEDGEEHPTEPVFLS